MAVVALKPRRGYSFTDHATANPAAPPPGDRLDGEVDRINAALGQLIDFLSVSLNSDGTLKPGSVSPSQIVPGFFDALAADLASRVQPLIEGAAASAGAATQAAAQATAASAAAIVQNGRAEAVAAQLDAGLADLSAKTKAAATAAETADLDASRAAAAAAEASRAAARAVGGLPGAGLLDAAADAQDAAASAAAAAASAASAANSANHADGVEAVVTDYGILTQAWAEHMPDTIPPSILAVMDVTGDHWSSRWWANQAAQMVEGALQGRPTFIVSPSSGDTVTIPDMRWLYINNPQTLDRLTILLPPTVVDIPALIEIGFRSPVTNLVLLTAAGAAIADAPVNAYGPGAAIRMRFDTPGWVYWK